jgi:hypothetical protein
MHSKGSGGVSEHASDRTIQGAAGSALALRSRLRKPFEEAHWPRLTAASRRVGGLKRVEGSVATLIPPNRLADLGPFFGQRSGDASRCQCRVHPWFEPPIHGRFESCGNSSVPGDSRGGFPTDSKRHRLGSSEILVIQIRSLLPSLPSVKTLFFHSGLGSSTRRRRRTKTISLAAAPR